jgi:predicted transcriptional regulator
LTSGIVSAFAANNFLLSAELPALIHSVHAALVKIASGAITPSTKEPTPAVTVRKSITPDYLICLDDGRQLRGAAIGVSEEDRARSTPQRQRCS